MVYLDGNNNRNRSIKDVGNSNTLNLIQPPLFESCQKDNRLYSHSIFTPTFFKVLRAISHFTHELMNKTSLHVLVDGQMSTIVKTARMQKHVRQQLHYPGNPYLKGFQYFVTLNSFVKNNYYNFSINIHKFIDGTSISSNIPRSILCHC